MFWGRKEKRGKDEVLAEFLILHITPYLIINLPSLSKLQ
jgi:hypothetical protein